MVPVTSPSPRPLSRRGFLQAVGVAGVGLGTAGLLAACGAGTAAQSTDKKTLNFLGGDAYQNVADAFTKKTGIKINNINLPYDGQYQRLVSEFQSENFTFDISAIDEIWIPQFADKAAQMDDLFTSAVKADLFDVLVKESQHKGHYVVMPAFTNVEILLYRKDLLESTQEAAAFKSKFGYDLTVPKDWKTFTDVAQHFTRDGLYGTDVKGAVETEWLAHVLQAGSPGVVLDSDGKVIINNKQHLEALTFYADLNNKYKVAPGGVAQVDWAAAQNLFNQGQTAMMRFWSHAYPGIPKDSPVYGKVGTAPMIGGSAGVAGIPGPWYLMVPEKAANKSAALEFAKFVYDNQSMLAAGDIHLAARKSVFEEFSKKPGYEHYQAVYDTLNASATKTRPATPKWQQITDTILIPTLQKSLNPGADYAAILEDAATKVKQVVGG
jgi:multiple sugar transport system substrate-binding protein